jgi:hypothetical protein
MQRAIVWEVRFEPVSGEGARQYLTPFRRLREPVPPI